MTWHLVTGEYPPALGGVAAYSALLATRLAAENDEVHVWTRGPGEAGVNPRSGVVVHRFDSMAGADLRRLEADLDTVPGPRRLVVQWVPHAFGRRSMNVPFTFWLLRRARLGDQIDLIVHEAFLPFQGSWRQIVAAAFHRLMITVALRSATRVWLTIPRWAGVLRPFVIGRARPMIWLPVPSNVPVIPDPARASAIRRGVIGDDATLIGHFGTYGRTVAPLLEQLVVGVLTADPRCVLLLIGADGDRFGNELVRRHPALATRVHATGTLPLVDISSHLAACDLMIQPYIDGVSTRRGTVMAALAHGRPVVTTSGPATEELWFSRGAVALAPATDPAAFVLAAGALIDDRARRRRLGETGRAMYDEEFAIDVTVNALRATSDHGRMGSEARSDGATGASAGISVSGIGAAAPADRGG